MNEFKSIWAPLNERSHMRKATNLYNFIYMKFYLEKANSSVRKQISGCLGEEWGKGIEYRETGRNFSERTGLCLHACGGYAIIYHDQNSSNFTSKMHELYYM